MNHDVDVLKNMADLFQVPVCYFFEEHPKDGGVSEPLAGKLQKRNRIIIALVSVAGLFAVATVLYVLSGLLLVNICDPSWMLYIYAIPPSLVLLLVFNSVCQRAQPRHHHSADMDGAIGGVPVVPCAQQVDGVSDRHTGAGYRCC